MKNLALLGSTGSIGTQALKVVERYSDRLKVVALAARSSMALLAEQIARHKPEIVSVQGPDEASLLSSLIKNVDRKPEILHGISGLKTVSTFDRVDSVLNGVVGAAGFIPTLAALRSGKEVLLANKESMVMAGELIREILDGGSGRIIPVDSEHSAIYQCLHGNDSKGVRKIILTGSGGPFRLLPMEKSIQSMRLSRVLRVIFL